LASSKKLKSGSLTDTGAVNDPHTILAIAGVGQKLGLIPKVDLAATMKRIGWRG
jgi:hypothetical protein